MKIVHLVNVVGNPPKTSDLYLAQQVTLEALRRAKDSATAAGLDVNVCAAVFEEDAEGVPEWMEVADFLELSSLDHSEFPARRKLPRLSEIWGRLIDISRDSDIVVYSNIDIAVQLNFYENARDWIGAGHDAVSVTRRTIPKTYTSPSQIDAMYSEVGEPHPGDDCFIVSRSVAQKLNIAPVYVGVSWFDKVLLLNIADQAESFVKLRDERLTFHIGDDRTWSNPVNLPISTWNKNHLIDLVNAIERKRGRLYWCKSIWPHAETIYEKCGFPSPSVAYRAFREFRRNGARISALKRKGLSRFRRVAL